MKRKMLCYILMAFLGGVSLTKSKPFESHEFEHQEDRIPHPPQANSYATKGYGNEEAYRSLSRLGSRPPNCAKKCEGCFPCEPVQIPATADRVMVLHNQFANYKPEGWKCKCGSSYFHP